MQKSSRVCLEFFFLLFFLFNFYFATSTNHFRVKIRAANRHSIHLLYVERTIDEFPKRKYTFFAVIIRARIGKIWQNKFERRLDVVYDLCRRERNK